MHRDALADGSRKAIDKIFGEEQEQQKPLEEEGGCEDDKETVELWMVVFVGSLVVLFFFGMAVAYQAGSRQREQLANRGVNEKDVKEREVTSNVLIL